MKVIYTGLESAGKSLLLADEAMRLFRRNLRWHRKFGFKRVVYSNLKFAPDVEEMYRDYIVYWDDYRQLIKTKGVDIIWDEISTDLSALKREPLARKLNQWLRQGAKQGVHIYATAQEFHDIHNDFRRRVSTAYYVNKIIGSRRGGEDMPPVKFIWGLSLVRELDIRPYNELEPSFVGFPSPFLITKDRCSVFDTHQTIQTAGELPLEHLEYKCEKPKCSYHKKPKIKHR